MTDNAVNVASSSEAEDVPPPRPDPPSGAPAGHRSHRTLITVLFVLATIIGIAAVPAVWVNRQALNTDNWTATSSRLLANKQIQTAVAAYAVTQLFSSGVPQAELKNALPARLQPLAGPISAGLQQVAGQAAPRLLATPVVQTAWREANRVAHRTLVRIINGGGSGVSTNGGVVTLNLHTIVNQLAATLGVQQQVAAAAAKLKANATTIRGGAATLGVTLPPSNGQLVILRSNQLKTAQDIASAIKGLALILPLLAFALFALAVGLARGWHRVALRTTGWCFVGIGLLTLLERRVAGNYVVDHLVKNSANRPAGHQVWTIGTSLLYDIAAAVVVYGLILVAAAWVAGSTRPAVALRRVLAPILRERPVAVYATAYLVLLLVIVWGPTPATRQLPYILGFIVLIALGLHALRQQTAREFPEAQAGDAGHALHAWYDERRSGRHAPATEAAAPVGSQRLSELERLSVLHDRGALTDEEFAAEKADLIHTS